MPFLPPIFSDGYTPSDRRRCIFEDVDGELEMEDVSGEQKEEKPSFANGISEVSFLEPKLVGIFKSASNMSELLLSPEGTPPLPPGSSPSPPPPPPSSSPSPSPPPTPPSVPSAACGPPPFLSRQTLPPQPLAHHPTPLPHEIGVTPSISCLICMFTPFMWTHLSYLCYRWEDYLLLLCFHRYSWISY